MHHLKGVSRKEETCTRPW